MIFTDHHAELVFIVSNNCKYNSAVYHCCYHTSTLLAMWLCPEITDNDVKIVTQMRNNQEIVRINTSPVCCLAISLPTLSLWSSVDQTSLSIALAPCRHENLPNCHGLHLCSSYYNVKNNNL